MVHPFCRAWLPAIMALSSLACTVGPFPPSSSSSSSGGCDTNTTHGTFSDTSGPHLVVVPLEAHGGTGYENMDSVVNLGFDQRDSVDGGVVRTRGGFQLFGWPQAGARYRLTTSTGPGSGGGVCNVTQEWVTPSSTRTWSCRDGSLPDGGASSELEVVSATGGNFQYRGHAIMETSDAADRFTFTFSGEACVSWRP